MTKEQQGKVRVMTERLIEQLEHMGLAEGRVASPNEARLIADLEQARQMALVVEELHRMGRKLDDMMRLSEQAMEMAYRMAESTGMLGGNAERGE